MKAKKLNQLSTLLLITLAISLLNSCKNSGNGEIASTHTIDEWEQAAEKQQIKILTTTAMVADLVKNIGGDQVAVKALMGSDIDPHSYQTKISDAIHLQNAEIIFYNGLHLEGKMESSLEQIKEKPVVAITSQLTEQELLKPQEEHEEHHDPHVWGDPLVWASCIKPVVATLSAADPENASIYKKNAATYAKELKELSTWAQSMIDIIPEQERYLITSHDAFFYLGRAYGLNVEGIQGISTVAEASLKHQVQLIKLIQEKNIKTIFPESSVNPKSIKNLAQKSGVQVSEEKLFSDAMGEKGDTAEFKGESYDKGTYRGMLMHNIITITHGLTQAQSSR